MQEILRTLDALRRPRLLVQAAREGCAGYRRDAHLRRLFGPGRVPGTGEALMRLIEIEESCDRRRRDGESGYSLVTHVDILVAMLAEQQMARAACAAPALTPAGA